jgi:hypothetical protein
MRHRCAGFLFLVIAAPILVCAQEYPTAEIFAGYSYLHVDTQGATPATLQQQCAVLAGGFCPLSFQLHPGFNGFNVSGQFNLNRWFGVKADFAGHYGNLITAKFTGFPPIPPLNISAPNQHIYDFLFGPVASRRGHVYTAFAHGLMGGEHVAFSNFQLSGAVPLTLPGPASNTSFAFVLGGGLDIKMSRHFFVRAGQFDYQFVNSSGNGHGHQNDFRFSSGILLAFGGEEGSGI